MMLRQNKSRKNRGKNEEEVKEKYDNSTQSWQL